VQGIRCVIAAVLEVVLLALFALTLAMAAATVSRRVWNQKRYVPPL
jgi:hypothetical protein